MLSLVTGHPRAEEKATPISAEELLSSQLTFQRLLMFSRTPTPSVCRGGRRAKQPVYVAAAQGHS
jgi:hypothetical protein